MTAVIRIGARGSPLSRAQTLWASGVLADAGAGRIDHQWYTTTGDINLQGRLNDIGGKGLFTKELDEALLRHDIDGAVHSMKDLPTRLPDGLEIAAILPREDPRDAWIHPHGLTLDQMPQGTRIGTASLRRTAQLLHARPDLHIAILRGNIDTRLRKLHEGAFDAIVLATAGLHRLGLADHITACLDPVPFTPAPAQGAVCIVSRTGDGARFAGAHHTATALCVTAERAALTALDGSCRTAIGAHAQLDGERLMLSVVWLSDDGRHRAVRTASCAPDPASVVALGTALGDALRAERQ